MSAAVVSKCEKYIIQKTKQKTDAECFCFKGHKLLADMSKTLIRAISLFRNLYCTQAIARYGTHRQDDQAILTGSHSRRNR